MGGQQTQLDALRSRVVLLKDEHEALCDCLAACGAVPAQRLLARLHRRRFAAAMRRHPCGSHESLETIAHSKELMLTIAARAGLASTAALGGASHALRSGVAASAPEIVTLFP